VIRATSLLACLTLAACGGEDVVLHPTPSTEEQRRSVCPSSVTTTFCDPSLGLPPDDAAVFEALSELEALARALSSKVDEACANLVFAFRASAKETSTTSRCAALKLTIDALPPGAVSAGLIAGPTCASTPREACVAPLARTTCEPARISVALGAGSPVTAEDVPLVARSLGDLVAATTAAGGDARALAAVVAARSGTVSRDRVALCGLDQRASTATAILTDAVEGAAAATGALLAP
jgi:hypothetical protein